MYTNYSSLQGFGAPIQQPGTGVFPGFMGTMVPPGVALGFGEGADAVESGGFLAGIGGLKGLGSIAQGLASLGGLYNGFKALGLAEDQFKFTKQAYRENLANAKQSYNTSLEDRIRARYNTEGRPASAVQGYLDKHSL